MKDNEHDNGHNPSSEIVPPGITETEAALDEISLFLLEEHKQRSAEISQNKIWRFSTRVFGLAAIGFYQIQIKPDLTPSEQLVGYSALMFILLLCFFTRIL